MKIPVKAIFSDAGNIIFDDRDRNTQVYEKLTYLTGIPKNNLRKLLEPYKTKAFTDKNYSYAQAWADLCDHLKLTPEQKYNIVETYKKQKSMELYPEVKETLKKIQKLKIPFIIITDAPEPASTIENMLKRKYRLEGIAGIVSSKDIGVMKPNKQIFEKALQQYDLKSKDVIFLAHDYDELKGAHDLGYNVLALNYEPNGDLSFIPKSRKIKTFPELLKKITNQG